MLQGRSWTPRPGLGVCRPPLVKPPRAEIQEPPSAPSPPHPSCARVRSPCPGLTRGAERRPGAQGTRRSHCPSPRRAGGLSPLPAWWACSRGRFIPGWGLRHGLLLPPGHLWVKCLLGLREKIAPGVWAPEAPQTAAGRPQPEATSLRQAPALTLKLVRGIRNVYRLLPSAF